MIRLNDGDLDSDRLNIIKKILKRCNFPNSSAKTQTFTTPSSTTKIDTRVRARSIAMTVKNTSTSQDWKLGTFRLDIQPDGRR